MDQKVKNTLALRFHMVVACPMGVRDLHAETEIGWR